MAIDLTRYNQRVEQWAGEIVPEIRNAAGGMGVQHRAGSPSSGPSLQKIRSRVATRDGAANKVSISFPRQLIYPTKGAGKGMGGSKGSRWIDKYGQSKKTNPLSLGKAGTGSRAEKPFFNNALDSTAGVERLADIAAEEIGAAITNNLFIN